MCVCVDSIYIVYIIPPIYYTYYLPYTAILDAIDHKTATSVHKQPSKVKKNADEFDHLTVDNEFDGAREDGKWVNIRVVSRLMVIFIL